MMARATAAIATTAVVVACGAQARDQIQIVGSSTVFPYSQAVAEEFVHTTDFDSPVVEATGTGGGMKVFCEGIGEAFPDITGASRAMKPSEYELCVRNGVTDITEVLLGHDGIAIAQSVGGTEMDLTKAELFMALAAEVPVDGEIVDNPYERWSEIDPSLPDMPIRIFGPPPTSGTRDAFVELVMEEGCAGFDAVAALPEERREAVCQRMRQDGPFIEAGENDNLIIQRLRSDPAALGIFGYSFLYENEDTLRPVAIEGVRPTEETIASGEYGISRPLFLYIKNAHRGVIPGLEELIREYVSENAFGPEGYLAERGLIPLDDARREQVRAAVLSAMPMDPPGS
jgi:phosphate transport system substrate-binding protein